MNKQSFILLAALLGTLISVPSIAQDDLFNQPELGGMFSISIPFDDPRPSWKREGTQLSFNMGFVQPKTAIDYQYQAARSQDFRFRPDNALADIKFDLDKDNWDSFTIVGVDNLRYERVVYADGTEAAEPSGFEEFEQMNLGARVAILSAGMIVLFSAADN